MKILYYLFLLLSTSSLSLKATHGLPLINLTYSVSSTGVTITADSDPSTCGSGPYFMQAYVSCTSSGFSNLMPPSSMQNTLAAWPCTGGATTYNQFPWYNSTQNIPDLCNDACVMGEAYNSIFIPFSNYGPGTTIYIVAREWVSASTSPGPFSTPYMIVTPGTSSAPLTYSLSASQYTICSAGSSTISITNVTNGPITSYTWNPSVGTGSVAAVTPSMSTTYTVTGYNNSCSAFTESLTINVIQAQTAAFIPNNPIICNNNNIQFSAVGGLPSATHSWSITPSTGWVNTNSNTTPTPDYTFTASGTYFVMHTSNTSGCITTYSTTVINNTCAGLVESALAMANVSKSIG